MGFGQQRAENDIVDKFNQVKTHNRATAAAELEKYFKMINRRLPRKVATAIQWLRRPSSFSIRLLAALLLIVGGIFSFLPVLGLWMLPLGLLLIAQDVPVLQKPLVKILRWFEVKWQQARAAWQVGVWKGRDDRQQ